MLVEIAPEIENKNILLTNASVSSKTEYLFSNPAVVRDILEGLAEDWDDCTPEDEAVISCRT